MPVLSSADGTSASSYGWVSGGTLSPTDYSATVGNGGMEYTELLILLMEVLELV